MPGGRLRAQGTELTVPVTEAEAGADEAVVEANRGRGRSGPHQRPFRVVLGAIALMGLVARVIYVVAMRHHPIFVDSLGYHFRAQLLADGKGFLLPAPQILGSAVAPPDAHVPPAWTVVLAGPTWLGMRSVLSQQLVACFVGSATIVMTGLAGRAAFGRRAGLIAAAVVAVYPNVWLYERELMPETLAMLGVATCLWLAFRFLAKPRAVAALVLGMAVGVLALTRAEEIAILGFLVLPVIMLARTIAWRQRVVWLAIAGFGFALFVVPWAAYNTARFHHPVLISTGLGEAMRAGNCEPTYSGRLLGYYGSDFRVGPHGCNILEGKYASSQPLVDEQLRHAAIEFMRQHEGRVPIVVAARIGRTFNVFRPFQQVYLEAERKSPIWVLRLALFSYWLLVPFAVFGAVLARRRRIPIYPFLAFPAVVVLAAALTIGSVRYRAPAEIPLALLAAFAFDVATRRRTSRSA